MSDDGCNCVLGNECEPSQMDFTFGKSCPFGKVRCCPPVEITSAASNITATTDNPTQVKTSEVATEIPSYLVPSTAASVTHHQGGPFQRQTVPEFHYSPPGNNMFQRPVFRRPTPIHVYGIQVPAGMLNIIFQSTFYLRHEIFLLSQPI